MNSDEDVTEYMLLCHRVADFVVNIIPAGEAQKERRTNAQQLTLVRMKYQHIVARI